MHRDTHGPSSFAEERAEVGEDIASGVFDLATDHFVDHQTWISYRWGLLAIPLGRVSLRRVVLSRRGTITGLLITVDNDR